MNKTPKKLRRQPPTQDVKKQPAKAPAQGKPQTLKADKAFDRLYDLSSLLFALVILPLSVLYLEVAIRLITGLAWSRSACMYLIMSSFALGLTLYALCSFFGYKINRIVICSLSFILCAVYAVYEVYFDFFSMFIDFAAMGEAGNMISDFIGNIILYTFKNTHWILVLLVPFFVTLFLTKRRVRVEKTGLKYKLVLCSVALVLLISRNVLISLDDSEFGDRFYYREGYNVTASAERFGLITSIRLNAQYLLFGSPNASLPHPDSIPGTTPDYDQIFVDSDTETTTGTESGKDEPVFVPVDRVTVDFNALISSESNEKILSMHKYFASLEPTKTNKYTGYFEGKNLIYITAEGFTSKMISPDLTPILYKMSTEGFVFENCYNSLWGGSTATGEYLALTGLFHSKASCLSLSGGADGEDARLMYYALGNTFKRMGYSTYAFHNHNPKYYDRDYSHKNFGFDLYLGANGTYGSYICTDHITYPTDTWPKSDSEMASLTAKYYLDNLKEPFLAYYMTVSGHANYNVGGNGMARKNYDKVAHLNVSEEVKAYIACSLELEYMLEILCDKLSQKGILEDTVFVISADHYPYGMSDDKSLAELYGLPENGIRTNKELFRNQMLIWSASMDTPVITDKYCSSLDLIPTVYNLFGVDYDSRLLMGSDVMSDTPGFVIINNLRNNWNWITDYGYYDTGTRQFTLHDGIRLTDPDELKDYVAHYNAVINYKQAYSVAILTNDYYRYVFK